MECKVCEEWVCSYIRQIEMFKEWSLLAAQKLIISWHYSLAVSIQKWNVSLHFDRIGFPDLFLNSTCILTKWKIVEWENHGNPLVRLMSVSLNHFPLGSHLSNLVDEQRNAYQFILMLISLHNAWLHLLLFFFVFISVFSLNSFVQSPIFETKCTFNSMS